MAQEKISETQKNNRMCTHVQYVITMQYCKKLQNKYTIM